MDGGTLEQLLAKAKEGDVDARNTLVEVHRSFVLNVVVSSCRRSLQWGRDDELSIGLIAFDEAVTRYEAERNVPFLAFARLVIKSRLANYFRQEVRRLSSGAGVSGNNLTDDTAASWTEFIWDRSAQDRAEEIQDYEAALSEYGISLDELVCLSPKHRDSRIALIGAAQTLAAENELFQHLGRKARLPVKKVSIKTGLSPKVIEKNRKYLLALTIIFRHPDRFIYLNSYIKK
jgi:RNA polymerase sigma factor